MFEGSSRLDCMSEGSNGLDCMSEGSSRLDYAWICLNILVD